MNKNQHIIEYLSYYISLSDPPKFAVLIKGTWGIGKTFLIQNFINSLQEEKTKHIYVSLYGIQSLDEINDAILSSIYPLLKQKKVKLGGRLLKTAIKSFNIDLDIKADDFLSKASSEIYIFDDLERCQIPIKSVMGYINSLVEHDDKKVIIIANEHEIEDKINYTRTREKLIGKSFEIQSTFNEAIDSFINSIKDESAKETIRENTKQISTIYHQSGLNNLRILQQTLLEFERIHKCFNDSQKKQKNGITILIKVIFALSFDFKSGRLSEENIKNLQSDRTLSFMREDHKKSNLPIDETSKRYPTVMLDSGILSDKTLFNLISLGLIDQQTIQIELDQSPLFSPTSKEIAWRTIWHSHRRTEQEVTDAISEMECEFLSHKFVITGEILHIFGIRLWLAKILAIPKTTQQVIDECKSYTNQLYTNKTLEPALSTEKQPCSTYESYGGLGIMESDTPEYKEIFNHLHQKRKEADRDSWPKIANDLLEILQENSELFLNKICITKDGNNEYYKTPILACLPPKLFVDTLLKLHPSHQHTVFLALKTRYEQQGFKEELLDEQSWASSIRKLLIDESNKMSPISKYRIHRLVEHGLDKVLDIKKHSQTNINL